MRAVFPGNAPESQRKEIASMAMSPKGKALYDKMFAARGFIYPAYELLCEVDPELLEKYEELKNYVMQKEGPFEEKYRELFISVAMAARNPSDADSLKNHLKRALKLGATVEEAVEALECALAPCGMPTLVAGCTLLKEVVDEGY
jgi:alkylhydroperoxidase/carboxymuconolactone decarboxylase family protein YurZ